MKLQNLFDKYNQKYFEGALADYKVIQSDRYGGLGMCRRKQREIHIQAGLAGRKLRETLLHEMAHANSNGHHGKSWLAEMYRLARAGAPTKKDADGYAHGQTINPPDMICMFEDHGLEAGEEGEWKNVRRAEGYSYGLVDKHGRAESSGARRFLQKLRAAFLRGVGKRKAIDKYQQVALQRKNTESAAQAAA